MAGGPSQHAASRAPGRSLRAFRDPILAALDFAAWFVAVVVIDGQHAPLRTNEGLVVALVAALSAVSIGRLLGLYTPRWKVGEFDHIFSVGAAALFTSIVLLGSLSIAAGEIAISGTLTIAAGAITATCGLRVGWRLWLERHLRQRAETDQRIVVFGAGSGGRLACEALWSEAELSYTPVAILDDDRLLRGRRIAGVVVEGDRTELGDVARRHGARHFLIAIPSAPSELIRELTERAEAANLSVHILPSLAELVTRESIGSADIRAVTPADLLGRSPADVDPQTRGRYVEGQIVLVTGAGGSIGSELCRQLATLGPKHLLMLDRDESALHDLQLSMNGQGSLDDAHLIVADIRDADRLGEIFARWRPTVVFHAAALKHLPLLELHPCEGFKTNVLGTQNMLDAAASNDVERFVSVSSDKAANATSVYGYTKRLAERFVAGAANGDGSRFLSVRFGNVLGSRGSMLHTFAAQVEAGGPLTITHPDVDRFFMTVEEAVSRVIDAGDAGAAGDVVILDMGEPVPILDVAKDIISRSGRDVEITYTGLRPGEKLPEELWGDDETIVRHAHLPMWHGTCEPLAWADVDALNHASTDHEMRALLRALAATTSSDGPGITTYLSPPEVNGDDRDALLRAFDSGWVAPAGPEIPAFERDIANYVDAPAAWFSLLARPHSTSVCSLPVSVRATTSSCKRRPSPLRRS